MRRPILHPALELGFWRSVAFSSGADPGANQIRGSGRRFSVTGNCLRSRRTEDSIWPECVPRRFSSSRRMPQTTSNKQM